MKNLPKVLLVCSGNWDSIGEIPYVLHKGGCEVDVLCSKNSWLIRNSYFHTWIETHSLADYHNKLVQLAGTEKYNWIILADEPLLKSLSEEITDEVVFKKILPLSKIENKNLLGSKSGLSELCDKYSITTPKTYAYKNNRELDTSAFDNLRFPVLIKLNHSNAGNGMVLCDDRQSLCLELANDRYLELSFVVQEYIKGKDIGTECLFLDGKLLVYQCSIVLEYTDGIFSVTNRREYFHSPEIGEQIRIIGERFGINGFASMQFIYTEHNDQYYLLESDLRPQAWFRYGEFTGNDFSVGVRMFTKQIAAGTILHKSKSAEKIEVVLFYRGVKEFIYKRNFSGIFSWLLNRKYWKYIPLYDKVYTKSLLTAALKKLIR